MRILDENDNELLEEDVDLEKGRVVETVVVKNDVSPIDNETKFAYDDNDYETVKRYIRFTDEELIEMEIDFLKQKLAETDYVVIKIAEGSATTEEYADIIASRKEWRKEINELEASLLALSSDTE